ncbi:MAG: HNH endonuclease, partial [Nocardioidaceae bacterium]
WMAEHLGSIHAFKIAQVIDLANQAPVDAYEIPDRHREAVQLMTPADQFPYATRVGRGPDADTKATDVDHNEPHADGGQTGVGNYCPLCRLHHRIKTHGDWQVHQPIPGIYLWVDPHHRIYLVDHTGTRSLRPVS